MAGMLWRVILAVIAVALVFALLPPVSRLIGFSIGSDLLTVIKICVAGLAVFYILRGSEPPWLRP